jgi:hypothetical protein
VHAWHGVQEYTPCRRDQFIPDRERLFGKPDGSNAGAPD